MSLENLNKNNKQASLPKFHNTSGGGLRMVAMGPSKWPNNLRLPPDWPKVPVRMAAAPGPPQMAFGVDHSWSLQLLPALGTDSSAHNAVQG